MYNQKELSIFSELSGKNIELIKNLGYGAIVCECFKNLYNKYGFILQNENINYNPKDIKIKGGFLKHPIQGKYRNVVVLDMDSMYPSIIIAFNLGPNTTKLVSRKHLIENNFKSKKEHIVQMDNNRYVISSDKSKGPLAYVITILLEKRRQTNDELEKKIYKKLSNYVYGLACKDYKIFGGKIVASAITHYARLIMKSLEKSAVAMGLSVLYADTDALFLTGMPVDKSFPRKLLQMALGNYYQQYFNFKVEYNFKYFEQYKSKQYYGITINGSIVNKGNFIVNNTGSNKIIITLDDRKLRNVCFKCLERHKMFQSLAYLSSVSSCNHMIQHKLIFRSDSIYIDPPVYLSKKYFCISNQQSFLSAFIVFLTYCITSPMLYLVKEIFFTEKFEANVIEIENIFSVKVRHLC